MDFGKYLIEEQLYESSRVVVYKALDQEKNKNVVLKIPNQSIYNNPLEKSIETEYEFLKLFQSEYIIKPFELYNYNENHILVLEDIQGKSLKELINNQQPDIHHFFKIALKIALGIKDIHKKNIIHKDINPSNIIYEPTKEELRIIDFSISSKYSQQNVNLGNPEKLEGTLNYISPEQTGRMNRITDKRSDFYSFGITLYELATGVLPFIYNDSLEIIHAHIARLPKPPSEINSKIPPALDGFILKLLSKNAEDRYNTADGIISDIKKCHELSLQLTNNTTIIYGLDDISDKLEIPQKLYGREKETEAILNTFEKCKENNKEIIVLEGISGIGKTALVYEIHKPVTNAKGIFIQGKFEQYQKEIPYIAFNKAFNDFIRQIFSENKESLEYWRNTILKGLGDVAKVIIDIIPDLKLIIGKQPDVPELSGVEAQNRLHYVIRNFIKSIAQPTHPLVIFIDDMQWADQASLDLMKVILTDISLTNLLFLVSYRINEVNEGHPLKITIEELEDQSVWINHIKLTNLQAVDIKNLLRDTLKIKTESNDGLLQLASIIELKTNGNPFFVLEFIKRLYRDQLIYLNQELKLWEWKLENVKQVSVSENVVELIDYKIKNLSPIEIETLRVCSCLGNTFSLEVLSAIIGISISDTENKIEKAIAEGILFSNGELIYSFSHDRIRHAIYIQLSQEEKEQYHYNIGKFLLKNYSDEKLDMDIFNVLGHINFNIDKIKDEADIEIIKKLNYNAGIKAKNSAAYDASYQYLKNVFKLIPAADFNNDYKFLVSLYYNTALVGSLLGNYNESIYLIKEVFKVARKKSEKVFGYEILINLYIAQSKYENAIRIGLKALKEIGVLKLRLPIILVFLLLLISNFFLFTKSKIKNLVRIKPVSDPKILEGQRLMVALGSAAYHSSPNLMGYLVAKNANIFLKNGVLPALPYTLTSYGLILAHFFKMINKGYFYGETGIQLPQNPIFAQSRPRGVLVFYHILSHLKNHLKESIQPLRDNYKKCLEIGDIEFGINSYMLYYYYSFWIGKPLHLLVNEIVPSLHAFEEFKNETFLFCHKILIESILILTSDNYNDIQLKGNYYNETKSLQLHEKINDITVLNTLYYFKLILSCIFNKYDESVNSYYNAKKYLSANIGTPTIPLILFYGTISLLQQYNLLSGKEKNKARREIKKNRAVLKNLAKHAPMNYLHKYYIIKAEIENKINNDFNSANQFYLKAVDLAHINSFLQEEALIRELAGMFYLDYNQQELAKNYIQKSFECYYKWGADSKAKQLSSRFSFLIHDLTKTTYTQTIGSITSTTGSIQSIDSGSIIKISQSLASEIKLNNLLHKMMDILLENAGATRGVFIFNNDYKMLVKWDEEIGKKPEIIDEVLVENYKKVPLSLINYVIRTKEQQVFDNLSDDQKFSRDNYVKENKPRSVICLPVLNKGELLAIIYLENNILNNAFSENHLEILKMLSSQIAISIENANLYEKLEEKVKQRTIQLLEASEAILDQKNLIEKSHQQITDSILYAKNIQEALLSNNYCDRLEHFIFIKPKDIVSGDFYLLREIEGKFIVAAADCTGHGVPGAFMSVLGMTFLNEILLSEKFSDAAEILEKVRIKIKASLRQTGGRNETKDGMDIAFCIIDMQKMKMYFSGAYNPLYLLRGNEMMIYKGTRNPIGIYLNEKAFENHIIDIKKGDMFYVFSDGYSDQFGGPQKHKFGNSSFKNLLLQIHKKELQKQKAILEETIDGWMKETQCIQTDDMLIIGVRI